MSFLSLVKCVISYAKDILQISYLFRSVCSEVGDTSYHSDSYGSQSTLDSRDSPYRDDLGRETIQGPMQPSSRDLQLVQGPRDRPNSLRIPGQSEFNRNNSFCSLPREKVRTIVTEWLLYN